MKDCFTPKKVGIGAIVGIIGTIALRWGVVDPLVRSDLEKKIKLEPGSQIWDIWTDLPIPIFIKFYFFNVTNPEEVTQGGKPILVELGPYVYEEKRRKIIINVNDETVKYRPKTHYYFRPDLSYGSQDDNITMLNVPFVGIIKLAWEMSQEPMVLSTLGEMLSEKGETVFHTHKVREYLFDGVSIQNYMELLSLPLADMVSDTIVIPKRLLDGSFGFFDDKNGTADDIWLVHSGKIKSENMAMTLEWNGKKRLEFWQDEKCDKIEGTDGTIFPPFADKFKVLKGFSPDFCRSVQMVYQKQSEFLGLSTMRFVMDPKLFGSLNEFPENECFCRSYRKYCKMGGVISLAPCTGGAPVFASRPHFSGAHKNFIDAVEGLTPKGDYESYFDVAPYIGLPIRGTLRMQINIETEPFEAVTAFATMPNLLFPLIWAEETATITEELAAPLLQLVHGLKVFDAMVTSTIVVNCILFIGALVWGAVRKNWHLKIAGK